MNILVTGAKGFVGKNLCWALKNIRDGKDRTRPNLKIDEIWEYDIDSLPEHLTKWCQKADFVFNLAGVNRPKEASEFMKGNFGFASILLDTLRKYKNRCPVMISSSIQATLAGRFGTSEYGKSKKAGEELMFEYEREYLLANTDDADGTDNQLDSNNPCSKQRPRVLVYRFPNLFGKWCRPNYNSAVATFCNNIANDLPIQVNDPNVDMELLYVDDLVDEMMNALEGREHRCSYNGIDVVPNTDETDRTDKGRYCFCPITHKIKLGEIVDLLHQFAEQPNTLMIPEIPDNSFAKKLYSTYLSYLPKEKVAFPLKMNIDERGSFTELIHTLNCGQVSINVSKPGITKGQHWHHSKWEFFIVVSGHGLIQERNLNDPEGKIIEFEVTGDHIQCIHMLPGYTHNIINLSETENLVTVMYCNEIFNPNKPDTFFEKVKE